MNIIHLNLLRSSREKTISKKKREGKNIFDKLLSRSISVDNEKKILCQDNAIKHEQLIFTARNVDVNSKSSLFEKFIVIKHSLIFEFQKWFSIA